jgi:hypothetical protein
MARLQITKKPFSRIEFHEGTYKTDVSDTDDECQIRTFDFTVEVTSNLEDHMVEITSITWVDDEPPAKDVAEDEIRQNFFDLTQDEHRFRQSNSKISRNK